MREMLPKPIADLVADRTGMVMIESKRVGGPA
ncbi:hypothetical protein ACVIW0_002237 [Bradyrhizobium sp. USDA 4454]